MSIAEFPGPSSVRDDDFRSGDGPGLVPPQDEEAEQSVLGAMLLSKDAIADVVEVIRGSDFYRPAHELIYDAVLDLYGRGEPVDAITVSAELTRAGDLARVGGGVYIHTLVAGVPVTANAGYYAAIVREKAILRRLVTAGTKIVQLGYAAQGQVDDVVDRAQAEVYSVTDRRASEDYAPLADIMELTIDELEAIGNRDGAMAGVPTGFAELDDLTNGLHPGQMVILAARPAVGKALALDTPLPTPTGWTTMGCVAVGDDLLGADGLPARVVAATDVIHGRPCYEIEFSDGTTIVADAQHEWATSTRANGSRGAASHSAIATTEHIAAEVRGADGRANHAVDNAAPLDLPQAALSVPPYTLGVWLGDKHSAAARLSTADQAIPEAIAAKGVVMERTDGALLCNVKLQPPKVVRRSCLPIASPRCPDRGRPSSGLSLRQAYRASRGALVARLRTIDVLGDKHIPKTYLRASEEQRRALLAGLLDTDGTVTTGGGVQLCLTSKRLADDARELIVSLGYRCHQATQPVAGRISDTSTVYILNFSATDDVFRLPPKSSLHRLRSGGATSRTSRRYITRVTRISSVPVRCVEIDNASHLYLATKAMIPTHNSTLGLDIARSASIRHGLTSCIFSLEMSRTEITMRLLSAEARIPLNHMRNGKMSDDDWNKLVRKMGEVSEAPLFIDDSPNLTMMEIRAKARRLKQRHDLRLIVVDYLQLMTSGKKVESRQVEVSEFSRQIKLLAKELEVPVVAISQLNRGSEQRTSKRPLLSDLRESGSLEQDSDMVILLHREDMYEKESTRPGEADLIVAKHRNGPTAELVLAFQGHYSRFVDMAQS